MSDLENFLRSGDMKDAPTVDGPTDAQESQEGASGREVESSSSQRQQPDSDAIPSWLRDTVDGLSDDEPEKQEEEEQPDPDELEERKQAFLDAGGSERDFWRQEFAKDEPAKTEQQEEDTSIPEEKELTTLQERLDAAKTRLATAYRNVGIAANISDEELDKAIEERAAADREVTEITRRMDFAGERLQTAQVTRLQGEYVARYGSLLQSNHGVGKQAADKISQGILKNPVVAQLMANPQTRELIKIPLVQDMLIKSALYDQQHGAKTKRRAPSDPGTRAMGGSQQEGPRRTGARSPEQQDADFIARMQGVKPGGNK